MKRTVINGLALAGMFAIAGVAGAEPPKFDDILESVEAKFEPATAKPGETVTLKLTARIAENWYTYPTFQPDKGARSQVNKLTMPEDAGLTFGEVKDPEEPKKKSDEILGIDEIRYLPGTSTWTVEAKVPADAKPGKREMELKFRMQVCGKPSPLAGEVCLRPETVTVPVTLTVVGE